MTTHTPALTRKRRREAAFLFTALRSTGVPDLVTAREAHTIAAERGIADSKYGRMAESKAVRLIDLAVYIARHKH